MRFLIAAISVLPFASCVPAPPVRPVSKPPVVKNALPATVAPSASAPLSTPASSPHFTREEFSAITFEGVAFDSRNHHLVVADQANGPGSQFADAASAGKARGGIVAVNAGFFTPEGAPLGQVVSAGKISGSWNAASSLGSGIWYEENSGNSAITRREKLGRAAASSMRELIQAGPLLIENGQPISGLEATKTSARSIILWDGGTRWWIGRSSPCTLASLGQSLASAQPAGWKIHQALNLDGGRSADLWISATIAGEPIVRRQPWNRPVRNFLVLVPQ
ncbi:MAG: phosphodiester glycosidase family protein [Luteolibacter sp.]